MKRVVLVHPDGLHQILGTDEGLEGRLPSMLPDFQLNPPLERIVSHATLFRTTPRAFYYREPPLPQNHEPLERRAMCVRAEMEATWQ